MSMKVQRSPVMGVQGVCGWRWEQWQSLGTTIFRLYPEATGKPLAGFNKEAASDLSSRKTTHAVVQRRLNGEDGGKEVPEEGVSDESGEMLGTAPQILMS